MANDARRLAIRQLVLEWGPLGEDDPTDPRLASGEYEWLVRGLERELDEGADARKLATYLTNAVRSRYGLDDPPPPDSVAERLATL
jgi:hypothetical protein